MESCSADDVPPRRSDSSHQRRASAAACVTDDATHLPIARVIDDAISSRPAPCPRIGADVARADPEARREALEEAPTHARELGGVRDVALGALEHAAHIDELEALRPRLTCFLER